MKLLKDADIKGKNILLRVDFNVTVEEGKVVEDFRMRAELPTVNYLLDNGANKIIFISHFGRPEKKHDPAFSLEPVSLHLADMMGKDVEFIAGDVIESNSEIKDKINSSEKSLIFLDNLRFYDEEEKNDEFFAKNLANFADVFVQDAFGVCHRKHASVVGVPKFIPSFAGLLIQKEVETLSYILNKPTRPLTFLIGGAKISTKMPIVKKFMAIADNVCIGGALANTALKAKGLTVGASVVEEEMIEAVRGLDIVDSRFHLPMDVVVSKNKDDAAPDSVHISAAGASMEDELILDIGPDTQSMFGEVIHDSKTVVWNGPMGYIENKLFAKGTQAIAREMADATAKGIFTVIGGGDTYLILEELDLMDKISFVSTGGGAMLDFLAEGGLPGITALEK